MSVLLTGGAGFIGSHIAVELINAGLDPIIADDFSNSSPDVIDRLYAITSKRIPCYEINVADAPSVSRIFEGNAIDAVIHCAGFKAVGESVSEPVRYYRNNLDTTLTILEQMKAHGCENIVFSSSADRSSRRHGIRRQPHSALYRGHERGRLHQSIRQNQVFYRGNIEGRRLCG